MIYDRNAGVKSILKVIDNEGTYGDIGELLYPGERRKCQERKAGGCF
jgi:hypothetical protein